MSAATDAAWLRYLWDQTIEAVDGWGESKFLVIACAGLTGGCAGTIVAALVHSWLVAGLAWCPPILAFGFVAFCKLTASRRRFLMNPPRPQDDIATTWDDQLP